MELTFNQLKEQLKSTSNIWKEGKQQAVTREWEMYKEHSDYEWITCNPIVEELPEDPLKYRHVMYDEENMEKFINHFRPKCVQYCYCEVTDEMKSDINIRNRYRIEYGKRNNKAKPTEHELTQYIEDRLAQFKPHYHLVCFMDDWKKMRSWRDVKKHKNAGCIKNMTCKNHVAMAINYCRKQEASNTDLEHLHTRAGGLYCNFGTKNCKMCDKGVESKFNHSYFQCETCRIPKINACLKRCRKYSKITKPSVLFKDLAMWFKHCTPEQRVHLVKTSLPYKELTYDIPFTDLVKFRHRHDTAYLKWKQSSRGTGSEKIAAVTEEIEEEIKKKYSQFDEFKNLSFNYKNI